MKRYNRSQTDKGEVLDDCYHKTSTLIALDSKYYIITIFIKDLVQNIIDFYSLGDL